MQSLAGISAVNASIQNQPTGLHVCSIRTSLLYYWQKLNLKEKQTQEDVATGNLIYVQVDKAGKHTHKAGMNKERFHSSVQLQEKAERESCSASNPNISSSSAAQDQIINKNQRMTK